MISLVQERQMGGVIAVGEKGVEADGWVNLALVDDERHKPLRQQFRIVLSFNGMGVDEFFRLFKGIREEVDAAWEAGYAVRGAAEAFSQAKAVIERYQPQSLV